MEALGVRVPWRGILVVYALTQVAASLPITPGGFGVVEASMTALLIAYGTRSTSALAVVLLYRVVSFWGLVPVGWGAWLGLELAIRGGLRHKAHPWAEHEHGPVPALPAVSTAPERVLRPAPCLDCPNGAGPRSRPSWLGPRRPRPGNEVGGALEGVSEGVGKVQRCSEQLLFGGDTFP